MTYAQKTGGVVDDLSSLERTGTVVFLLSSLALLLYVLVFGVLLLVADPLDVVAFTSIEWLVKLAVIGLVVGFTTRAKHWSVLMFGLFLVGVLILPAKDVARYILIWAEKESEFQSLYDQVEPGLNLAGRERELANEIIHELESGDNIKIDDVLSRKQITEVIVEKIRRETLATLRDRLQSNGTLTALRVLGGDDGVKLGLLKYGDNDRFITEVRFLRSVGLVTFPYDDIDAVQLTKLGQDLMNPPAQQDSADGDLLGRIGQLSRGVYDCPVGVDSTVSYNINELQDGRDVRLNEHSRTLLRLRLVAGVYEITVSGENVDPIFGLYLREGDQCSFLGSDDDGGEDLNSKREFELQQDGEYVIETWSIYQSGRGTLTVTSIPSGGVATDSDVPP